MPSPTEHRHHSSSSPPGALTSCSPLFWYSPWEAGFMQGEGLLLDSLPWVGPGLGDQGLQPKIIPGRCPQADVASVLHPLSFPGSCFPRRLWPGDSLLFSLAFWCFEDYLCVPPSFFSCFQCRNGLSVLTRYVSRNRTYSDLISLIKANLLQVPEVCILIISFNCK